MKERKLPSDYLLYDTSYSGDVPMDQLFIAMFDNIPSKFSKSVLYDTSIIEHFKTLGFIVVATNSSTNRRDEETKMYFMVNDEKKMMIKLYSEVNKTDELLSISFVYDVDIPLTSIIDFEILKTFERNKKRSNINLIKMEHGHLDLEEFDLTVPDTDLELNYGSTFVPIHDTIITRLNKPRDKGIILLHGDPGSGKTSYIKYLTKLITDKEILFVPPSMAEMLSEPSIIPFLMDHKDSILIIEDAERVISDRDANGSSAGVSNILNLTDGILGDCLNIQIIATFNMKREKIDQALLRKGRLIAEHKFSSLSIDDTNRLLKHIGKDIVVNQGMLLSDIYNIDVEVHKTTEKTKIGFNR
jgi:hypothetical protein